MSVSDTQAQARAYRVLVRFLVVANVVLVGFLGLALFLGSPRNERCPHGSPGSQQTRDGERHGIVPGIGRESIA